MPNHVDNSLKIVGNKDELKRFIKFAKTKDKDLDHEKFIPYPQKFKDMDKDDSSKSFNLKHGSEEDKKLMIEGLDGHGWACKYWGTKWGIYDCSMTSTIAEINKGNELYYIFQTAWSPCFPIIEKMSEMFPNLTFELEYEEGGSDFEGTFLCEKGDIMIDDQRKFTNTCEECSLKADEVTYDEDDETTLCESCRMTPLQKIVNDKINSMDKSGELHKWIDDKRKIKMEKIKNGKGK